MKPIQIVFVDIDGTLVYKHPEKGDTIEEEKLVTVRQYYESAGQASLCEPNGVSSSNGWTNLDKAKIEATTDGNGYQIILPRPVSLSSK